MFPVSLDLAKIPVILAGGGKSILRRLTQLDEDGAKWVKVYADNPLPELVQAAGPRLTRKLPRAADIAEARAIMVADLPLEVAESIAVLARGCHVLVNVEDHPKFCDFHFTSYFRRGELLMTVSTGGTSPALAKNVREYLEQQFGPEWEEVVSQVSQARDHLRAMGKSPQMVAQETRVMLAKMGIFGQPPKEQEVA